MRGIVADEPHNHGAPGIDGGMPVKEVNANWPSIKESILAREYRPKLVWRVEIPKPNGGVRKLGIPSVVNRVFQQSIVPILTPIFEAEFRYEWVVRRTCIVRAISKEILIRRGLVSVLDYYTIRHTLKTN